MEQSAVKLAEDAFNPEILDEFVKVLKYPSIKDVMGSLQFDVASLSML